MARAMLCAVLIGLSGLAAAQDDKTDAAKAPAAESAATPAAQPAAAADAAAAPEPAKSQERVLQVEKSNAPPKCEIKPVMSDDELRACGARIGDGGAK
jgi:hypothetical protein